MRRAFWAEHPDFERVPGRRQNDYNPTIRAAFVDWVDSIYRDGRISDSLAGRVTL